MGIPAICAYLGGIDSRTCKKYILDMGLQPVWAINRKLCYYDKADVDRLVKKLYKVQTVKL